MKQFDILVVGELNIDLIFSQIQGEPKVGTEILAKEMVFTLGSSSAIFACNAATLKSKVGFIGKIGSDYFGNYIIESLKSRNVKTLFIIRSADYKTGATVALNYGNDRAMITHPGAMEYLTVDDVTSEVLNESKHLHISSLFLQPKIKKDLLPILKLAKKNGLTTSLDTQWDPAEKWDLDLKQVLPLIDVFLPNEAEFLALTKQSTIEKAIEHVKPFVNMMAVKMGTKGAIGYHKGELIKVEPFLNSHVVDAIGAGDSFDAGFIVKYIRGAGLRDCLTYGNLTGAINTTAAGGTTAFSSFEKVKETAKKHFAVEISL